MDRSQLLQHFETLAETPDAVSKLRALVLDLAVRGRLVPQASEPDKDAAWQKFCREVDERPHNAKSVPAFEMPHGWRWVALEAIAEPCGQKKPDERFTYIDVGAIDNERGVISPDVQVLNADEAPSRARKLVRSHSVIYSTVRPYLRNIAVIEKDFNPPAIVSTAFAVLHPKLFLNSRFLFHWLRSAPFQEDVARKMKGVAYPAISDSEFWECLIPVPPPEEQRRIVTKVEELLALCDELEARQTLAREDRASLVRSALDHVTTAKDESDFKKHFAFCILHSELIFDSVPALRQAILSLAVQGRLVPQNPKDQPVTAHLSEIEKAKAKLVSKGVIRLAVTFPEVLPNEAPDQIPANWKWVRVGVVGMTQTGSTPPTAERQFFGDFIPFVKPADLTDREINYQGEGLSQSGIKNSSLIASGSVLMVCIGGSIGKTNLNTRDVCCNQQINTLTPYADTDSRYIMACMKSAWFQGKVREDAGQTTLPIISKGKWEQLPIPLPPLAEQQRIVAKVDELMQWCDELESRLASAHTAGTHLLDATLHRLLIA